MKVSPFILLLFLSILSSSMARAQSQFTLPPGVNQQKIDVNIVSNIVIIPVLVNGVELSFILDTGANGTIIFQVEADQKIEAKNAEYIALQGAGEGQPIKAIKSSGNRIQVGDAVGKDESMYVILDERSNFSPRLGYAVQGILGYEFFKDFIVEINYIKEHITIHRPASYTYKNRRKQHESRLIFYRNRPYIEADVAIRDNDVPVWMLLDSGASDAMWLFRNDSTISLPKRNFSDYLGTGLNGSINGARAYTDKLTLGPFQFEEVTTAFPDSTSIKNLYIHQRRNGSIGADFLKRFHCIIDYPNAKVTLTKNRNYNDPFVYNKSGLTIEHGDDTIAQELLSSNDQSISRANEYTAQIVNIFKTRNYYKKVLLPTYEIAEIRPGSPAALSGFEVGDVLLRINNKNTSKLTLEEINRYFYQNEGKVIRIRIERGGIAYDLSFTLKDIL